jgi:signal transduction histidine kinase
LAEIVQATGDGPRALALCTESRSLLNEQDDSRTIAHLLLIEGQAAEAAGDMATARTCYDSSRRLFEGGGDRMGIARTVLRLSTIAMSEGDARAARPLLEIYVSLTNDPPWPRRNAMGICLRDAALAAHEWGRSIALLEGDLAQFRQADDARGITIALRLLGTMLIDGGVTDPAVDYLHEGLLRASELDDKLSMLSFLVGFTRVAMQRDQRSEAAQLCGASEALATALGAGYIATRMWPSDRMRYRQTIADIHSRLDDPNLAAAWTTGRGLVSEAAVEVALEFVAIPFSGIDSAASETAPAIDDETGRDELEAFAYTVSHDLRAPLRAISGYTSILQEDYAAALDVQGQDVIATIQNETGRMAELLDDLIAFARIGYTSLHTETVDMTHLAANVFADLTRSEDRMRIAFQIDRLPPTVGDASMLRQVWVNLLGNAVKYSGKRPRAVITIEGVQERDASVYKVQDNGAGFDMAHVDKLFGVFQRLHSESEFPGTGVGLAIVQRIIERHGGRIWAESVLDQGATFWFRLPKEH